MMEYLHFTYSTLILLILYSSQNFIHSTTTTSNSITDSPFFDDPVLIDAETEHTASIIFIHALQQKEFSVEQVLSRIRRPYMKVILPTPILAPITFYEHYGKSIKWFDVLIEDERTEIDKACHYLHSLIDKEKFLGIPPERIIMAGYQQPALIARYAAHMYPQKLGGFIGFLMESFIYKNKSETLNDYVPSQAVNRDMPCLYFNSFPDNATSAKVPFTYTFKTYSGHQDYAVDEERLQKIHKFIDKHVPEK